MRVGSRVYLQQGTARTWEGFGIRLLRETDRVNNTIEAALFSGKARYLPSRTDLSVSLWVPLPVWLISSKTLDMEYTISFAFIHFLSRYNNKSCFCQDPCCLGNFS